MRSKNLILIPIVATALLVTTDVIADGISSGFAIEEVVVTARKREESLQNTPIAVSAFTEKELEYRQIDSTDKLGNVTPNLTFDSVSPSSGSSSTAQIFIRGIGQTDFTPVTDPGVGLYVDGVYMARSVGGVLDFLDVDRIEVLRGPQGTLFGRNSIGGAISIHSKRPSDELDGSLKVDVGDDDLIYVTGKISGPLTDELFANLAISKRDRDGYVERVFDGVDLGDKDSLAVRGSALWQPSDSLEVYVAADATRIRENGAPAVSVGLNNAQTFPTFGNGLLASCPGVTINAAFPAGPPSFPPPGDGAAAATTGVAGCLGPQSFIGEFTNGGSFPVKSDLDIWGVSGEISWDMNDWLSIKSITAYRDMDFESSRDGDHTVANVFATQDFIEQNQFSQELQFSGMLFEDRMDWLLGFYYFQEDGFNRNPVFLPVGSIQSGGLFENESKAAFFQTSLDFTDKLEGTVGIRYTQDTKKFTPDQISLGDASASGIFPNTFPNFAGFYLPPLGAGPPIAAGDRLATFAEFDQNFASTDIMANLAYQFTDNFMAYLTYSEGFKSGGFDQRFTGFTVAPSTFDPETVKSYEIGFKTDLFDDRVRLNVALFKTDYEDLQIIIRESFNPITFNGGTADIRGAEVELTFVPTDRWFITAAVGYIDAEYHELDDSVTIDSATPLSTTNKLVNTPEISISAGVAYTFDIGNFGALTPRLDWSFHGEQFNDALNTKELFQENYHLWNAALSFETNDGKWESILGLQNITDETYLVTGNSALATASGYSGAVFGRPFGWALSLQYNFF